MEIDPIQGGYFAALAAFLIQAVVISLSGVMAPGPMTTITVGRGGENPHAGALIALGHGAVEVPLMLAIFYGFGYFVEIRAVKTLIFVFGGLFLLFMAWGMFSSLAARAQASQKVPQGSPVFAGMMLSLGNPYFLIWWVTIGASLTLQSVRFGLAGFAAFAFIHWLCDLVWLYFLSALSFKGGQFFGRVFQRVIFVVCGVALVFFGVRFLFDGFSLVFGPA